jgi:hypothetical protein
MPLVPHGQISITGGNMAKDRLDQVKTLLDEFDAFVDSIAAEKGMGAKRAIVRSRLMCEIVVVLDDERLWVVGAKGFAGLHAWDRSDLHATVEDLFGVGRWEFGFSDPFVFGLPRYLLDQCTDERTAELRQYALEWVESEVRRTLVSTQLIQLRPVFGPSAFRQEANLCFVIMPFAERLTRIYQQIVKPTVEEHEMACIRADDIRTNRAIMDNIWKSICEARLIIADLTSANATVFYELGIAHTVGKETILISQREGARRPFDVLHLRSILYEDTVDGREALRRELWQSIREVLNPVIVSTPLG